MSRFAVDHLVHAVADLERGCDEFAELTGCRPIHGGPHPGLGTANALVSFGDSIYLELIGPDPSVGEPRGLGRMLAALPRPTLYTWALRHDDLQTVHSRLAADGFEPGPVTETVRQHPNGTQLAWDLMGCPNLGGAWPFYIDWRNCPHPSHESPWVGSLLALEVALPVDDCAKLPFADTPRLRLVEGTPRISLAFESPRGPIEWTSDDPNGFFRQG